MTKHNLSLYACALAFCAALPFAALAEADYRALDREARALQAAIVATRVTPPASVAGALLAHDPALPVTTENLVRDLQAAQVAVTQDVARLRLARDWIRRGYDAEAARLLSSISGGDAAVMAERILLEAGILARQGRADEAAALLESVQSPQPWRAYARFNRAAALREAGREDLALGVLQTLAGSTDAADAEILALRDKARIALGLAHLRRGETADARAAFEKVRFDGPFSAQALLGLGWVEFDQDNASRALIPWLELSRRGRAEPAVQEVMLLIPYAQWHLGAYRDAVQQYQSAIDTFDRELALLDRMIGEARNGGFVESFVADDVDGVGPVWRLPEGARAAVAPDFTGLPRFQAAQATWRHLQALERAIADRPGAQHLRPRLAQAIAAHRAWLQDQAAAELARLREHTAALRSRGLFEFARLLDEIAARSEEQ